MGPALLRIDDRLLHGQVALGWAAALGTKLIVICNDELAGDEWSSGLFAGATPPGVRLEILTLGETVRRYEEISQENLAAIVLLKSPRDVVTLLEMGARPAAINVGGMHFEEGKRRVLPYLFVDEDDVLYLRSLIESGISVRAQDVPGAESRDLRELLRSVEERG